MSKPVYLMRIYFLIALLSLCAFCLVARLIYLGTSKREFLQQQGAARSYRVIDIPAHRGMIVDRNNVPLAISTPVDAVWLSPQLYQATLEQEKQLTKLLKIKHGTLKKKIAGTSEREFVYLKRHLPPQQAELIKKLQIPGIFIQQEYQRYYPEGEVTAHVLGFTDIDDHGAEGLELTYDQWLRGIPGKREVAKDRLGHIVNELRVINEPKAGNDLILSLDRNIQYLAYKELQNAVENFHAEAGSVVILDAKTNEVLAMVNQPSFNPNAHPRKRINAFRNRAITDLFEPGSTLKTFSIASALESGKYKPNSIINTAPGYFEISGHKVSDLEEHIKIGELTVTEILKRSSDVGVAKITLSLPPNRLLKMLQRVGFGESTYSGFPGEARGRLPENLTNRPFVLATLAFGYAISTTALHLARAYAVLASKGILQPVTFLKLQRSAYGQQVLEPKLCKQMLAMLESVLQTGGTATRAQITGYRVAGKTGTARIAGKKGYEENRYNSIFVGIAPVSTPRLVIAVVIKNPMGSLHYGGLIAAPTFANIMAGALRILNVKPDN